MSELGELESLRQCVRLALNAGRITVGGDRVTLPPCIWGPHGVAKSAVVRSIAYEAGMGFIDTRLSQIEGPDLRGMYIIKDGRTANAAPTELPGDIKEPVTCGDLAKARKELADLRESVDPRVFSYVLDKEVREIRRQSSGLLHEIDQMEQKVAFMNANCERGILFLDEWNRGRSDVTQAAFQLIYDRSVGMFRLHYGWDIVLAANPPSPDYEVTPADKALLDRMTHLFVSPSKRLKEDWSDYMANRYGADAAPLIAYVQESDSRLFGKSSPDYDAVRDLIDASMRSSEVVACVSMAARMHDVPIEVFRRVLSGLIGQQNANAYLDTEGLPVRPSQIIGEGVRRHEARLNQMDISQVQALCVMTGYFAREDVTVAPVVENVLDFADWVLGKGEVPDAAVGMVKILTQADSAIGGSKLGDAKMTTPELVKILQAAGDESLLTKELSRRDRLRTLLYEALDFDPNADTVDTSDAESGDGTKSSRRRKTTRRRKTSK